MKKIVQWAIITSVIIGGVVWIVSEIVPFSYSEWSFFIGLGITIIMFLFNSSGGFLSKGAALEASEANWKVQKENNELKINVGGVFYGALLYTFISFVVMILIYF